MAPKTALAEDIEMGKRLLDEEKDGLKHPEVAPQGARKQLIDGACILLNITSTVTLVFLNKWCEQNSTY